MFYVIHQSNYLQLYPIINFVLVYIKTKNAIIKLVIVEIGNCRNWNAGAIISFVIRVFELY